ncbi:MAG: hypothetical protein HYY50_04070 [Candidatus Kerfeldbacteria bacterium]|nr:hypothetical protein [Candidatus Kerfeldbacteria bacterium]
MSALSEQLTTLALVVLSGWPIVALYAWRFALACRRLRGQRLATGWTGPGEPMMDVITWTRVGNWLLSIIPMVWVGRLMIELRPGLNPSSGSASATAQLAGVVNLLLLGLVAEWIYDHFEHDCEARLARLTSAGGSVLPDRIPSAAAV